MAARKTNAFRFDLSKPTKRGTLMKQGGLHRAFKYRFFILYPGFLVYYDTETKWKSDLTKGETLGVSTTIWAGLQLASCAYRACCMLQALHATYCTCTCSTY